MRTLLLALLITGCSDNSQQGTEDLAPGGSEDLAGADLAGADLTSPSSDGGTAATMSFFVTSRGGGMGGDLRAAPADADGLAGADALCKTLATAVSASLGAKTWRAYLSTATVNARDRIGTGPWSNAAGTVIAQSVAELHEEGGMTNKLNYDNSLDETGQRVPGVMRPAGTMNVHDILTGSGTDGRVLANQHCNNWTSSTSAFTARVGHSDRMGGGSTNWNSVHNTGGCTEMGGQSVRTGGGRGSLFCFATN
jgi:hypothetical protein